MPRRPTRPPRQRPAVPDARPANHCRAVILVDGSGIRKKIKRDYDKALRDLDNSRRQLDQFQQTDQPQFTRWLHGHFGALLTELRELHLQVTTDDNLVFMVQSEVMFHGGSYARAYKRVMELRDNPEMPPPPNGENNGEPDPFGRRPEPENPEAGDDPFKTAFEETFGVFGPDEDPREFFNPRGRPTAAAPPVQASKRLKDLYRAVVRRLHPDKQQEMTPQKTEWWHQAQAAYETGDAEQLEVILTLCEIGESGTTAHTSVSLLQHITAQLKSSLREIKRQIAHRRREPAWNFSSRTDHAAMAHQIERDLTAELTALRQKWATLQKMIAKWKTAAERLKPSRRRNPTPRDPGFWF